jgi:hypothetical protein
MKCTASQIVNYAKSLADLQDTSFITYGDAVLNLNLAYRKVYQDIINNGDLNYLEEVEIINNANKALYELPADFYQLAMVVDEYGVEVPKLRLSYGPADYGFIIKNNTIYFQNVQNTVTIKYYPNPAEITYKADHKALNSALGMVRFISGFDKTALTEARILIDITNLRGIGHYAPAATGQDYLLGENGYICKCSTGQVFPPNGNVAVDNVSRPLLTTSGYFVEGTEGEYGWCNDDKSARFTILNGELYFNGENLGFTSADFGNNMCSGRCFYHNGKWALLTNRKIIYEDGSWETTDVQNAQAVLKADKQTGYGYVSASPYHINIDGWAPETLIDFPNNIFFEMVAYDLAIQFRNKQFADANPLIEAYNKLEETYWKTLPQDQNDYVTIRNVNKAYTRWRMFI